jgi:hypothetical protein
MDTGLLEFASSYTSEEYIYFMGGDGTHLVGSTARKGIDCSHQVKRLLDDAGYSIPYKTTSQMAVDTQYYDAVAFVDAQPGDIALWVSRGHTGVFVSFEDDASGHHLKGRFFGAQTSTGPAQASFGGSAYWPVPEKVLRPKAQYRSGAALDSPPAVAPKPKSPPVAPINFEYPIRAADGSKYKTAQDLYNILEAENSGHYLLGKNNFWHGGIHITDKCAPQCQKIQPVRCIADGVVVAYRLNEDYLQSQFEGANGNLELNYSNSFCLVRHDYKSAPNTANEGKQNSLVFYSLYMHLLPYTRYLDPVDPSVNVNVRILEGGYRAHSQMPGMANDQILGLIPAGVEFEILDQQVYEGITYAKGKILRGNVPQRHAGDEIWFGYKKNGETVKSNNKLVWREILPPERTRPGYWQGEIIAKVTAPNGLAVLYPPANLAQNAVAGAQQGTLALTQGSQIKFDSGKIYNLQQTGKLLQMAECTLVRGGLREGGILPTTFWMCIENAGANKRVEWAPVAPSRFNSVIAVNTAIKAGAPIGYLGLHEVLSGPDGGKTSKYQVHLEVFSEDDNIEAFLNNEAGLTQGKQYLSLPAGAILSPKAPATTAITLSAAHAIDLASSPICKDSAAVEWYQVTVKEDGQTKTGLVKKQDADLITQHDWAKLGFTVVKESDANADGFLDPEKMPDFFQALYAKIDGLGNHDGAVTPDEFSNALKNVELRDQWSKLIAYHPTEWQAKSSDPKWARLDDLLKDAPAVLRHEQDRIDKLVFWDDLSIRLDKQVYHFHLLELVGNFLGHGDFIDIEKFIEHYSAAHMSFEGDSVELNSQSKSNIRDVVRNINKYVRENSVALTVYELSYMFATARVEAYHFTTQDYYSALPEIGNLDYFNKYDPVLAATQALRNRAVSNGNTVQGDGYKYRGRGLVHLTWKNNYQKAKDKYGYDFVSSPELAADYDKAVPIMIWGMLDGVFSGAKLGTYINNDLKDYAGARNVINGTDRKDLIASHAIKFESILRETSVAPEIK